MKKENERNANLLHLKNIVSEERMDTYESIYKNMLLKRDEIVSETNSFDIKNRNLNWLYADGWKIIDSLKITDIKEKYFAKRFLMTFLRGSKNKVKRIHKKINNGN